MGDRCAIIVLKNGGDYMLNTFDALANFPDKNEKNGDTQQNDTNASVDISAIINRLNEMETKINELVNKTTDFPTRGNNNPEDNTVNSTDDNDDDKESE